MANRQEDRQATVTSWLGTTMLVSNRERGYNLNKVDSMSEAAPETPGAAESLVETYRGRPESPEELFGLVYNELRQVARAYMKRERADHTLQATALVNEAYLRLFSGQRFQWQNRN